MKRLLVISDIHGQYEKFKNLLNEVDYNKDNDQLILLGDYCDRGSQSIKTLLMVDKLIDNGAIALIGNHDDMFREIIDSEDSIKEAFKLSYYEDLGTMKTLGEYMSADIDIKNKVKHLLNNKLFHFYEYGKYIFVHGGVNANVSLDENNVDDILWSRERFYKNKAYDDKIVVFGHTPTCNIKRTNQFRIWRDEIFNDKIGIDCASVYGGKLACLDLTNNKEYYV